MSWLLTQICHACYQEENNIEAMSINTNTLCQTHRIEWGMEKNEGEYYG